MATSSRRRAGRSRRRNSASDLGARVWVAIPAVVYAIDGLPYREPAPAG